MTNGADEEAAAENQPGEAAGNQPNEAAEPTQPAEATEMPPPPGEAAPSGAPPSRGGWVVPKWVVAGTAVSSPADLAQQVRSHQPGDQVTITYTRGGNSTDAPVQLGDRSTQNAPAS